MEKYNRMIDTLINSPGDKNKYLGQIVYFNTSYFLNKIKQKGGRGDIAFVILFILLPFFFLHFYCFRDPQTLECNRITEKEG